MLLSSIIDSLCLLVSRSFHTSLAVSETVFWSIRFHFSSFNFRLEFLLSLELKLNQNVILIEESRYNIIQPVTAWSSEIVLYVLDFDLDNVLNGVLCIMHVYMCIYMRCTLYMYNNFAIAISLP